LRIEVVLFAIAERLAFPSFSFSSWLDQVLSELRMLLLRDVRREWSLRIGLARSPFAARMTFPSFSSSF
jgi:hypothetical protein